ncbi:MAG: NCAIR mutase (PurE)-related protein, partial [Candidatus Paceibacteria bacterium]
MNPADLERLLSSIRIGELSVSDGLRELSAPPVHDLGHTRLDSHRALRCGHPEVVYGAGKTPEQLAEISSALAKDHGSLLVTRASAEGAAAVCEVLPNAVHHPASGCITLELPPEDAGEGLVLIICAGTSDRPVAEEAAITARLLGA